MSKQSRNVALKVLFLTYIGICIVVWFVLTPYFNAGVQVQKKMIETGGETLKEVSGKKNAGKALKKLSKDKNTEKLLTGVSLFIKFIYTIVISAFIFGFGIALLILFTKNGSKKRIHGIGKAKLLNDNETKVNTRYRSSKINKPWVL